MRELEARALLVGLDGSFEPGFFYGVAEGLVDIIQGLADLLNMIVLEGIYQRIHSPLGRWYDLLNPSSRLADIALDYFLHSHLETAHREFHQLTGEPLQVASHPLVFLGKRLEHRGRGVLAEMATPKELMEDPGIANSFSAGRIAGQTA